MQNRRVIQETLLHHLKDPSPDGRTLVVTGPWGCGKTHLWKNDLQTALKDVHPLYLSLFGVDSLSSFKSAIMTANLLRNANLAGDKNFKGPGLALLKLIGVGVAKKADAAFGVGALGLRVDPLQVIEEGLIICVDDLERVSPSVPFEEVLGTMTMLAEAKRARVLMIMNEQYLLERDEATAKALRRFKERVVHAHLGVEADVRAIFDLMAPRYGDSPQFRDFIELCKPRILQLFNRTSNSNLRTLARILAATAAVFRELPPGTLSEKHVLALTVFFMEAEEGRLRDEDFYDFNYWALKMASRMSSKKSASTDQASQERLDFVDKYFGDAEAARAGDLFRSLHRYVKIGYFDRAAVEAELAPAQQTMTPAETAASEANEGRWLYYSDLEHQAFIDRVVDALKQGQEISTALLMDLLVFVRLSAERAAVAVPEVFGSLLEAHLDRNAERQDTTFGRSRQIRLSEHANTWKPYFDRYDQAFWARQLIDLVGEIKELVAKRDAEQLSLKLRETSSAVAAMLHDEVLPSVLASWKADRQFHSYAISALVEQLSMGTVDGRLRPLRTMFLHKLRESTNDPEVDNSQRWLFAQLLAKCADWEEA